jgi:hypothetical protein
MGGDGSQKLLPWRGISLLSGAQTSGSQQNQHQHCTEKLGRISVGGRRLAQLHTAWIILGKYTWIISAKRRRSSARILREDAIFTEKPVGVA